MIVSNMDRNGKTQGPDFQERILMVPPWKGGSPKLTQIARSEPSLRFALYGL